VKLTRAAFLYFDPQQPADKFAQCGTCRFFCPGAERCALFGDGKRIRPDDSCNLYVKGAPTDNQRVTSSVTPEEAGWMHGQVRCENCAAFIRGKCHLYILLNQKLGSLFRLDEQVDPKGCCNGFHTSSN